MKKLLVTLAVIPAATWGIEASAQTYVTGNANANATVQHQIVQLQTQLDAGVRAGAIDRTERRRLRQEIRALTRLRAQYAANGLSTQEWNLLQQRVGNLSQQIQIAGGGYAYGQSQYGTGYTYGNAYGNTGVRYDQYGRPMPAPSYDRYGRPIPNSGYYGQGGPYTPYPSTRSNSGVGGVLGNVLGSVLGGGSSVGGNILGSILSRGGLRVGDVITGVLGNVLGTAPMGLGFQDRNDVYFRSDGHRVYEIDARTNTVLRVHPLQ